MKNLFAEIPTDFPEEIFDTLVEATSVRIERIVSRGHASPPGDWYDQEQAEWVVVLHGGARLAFAGEDEPVMMGPGDAINIPAHRRHRVEWTSPDEPTVWLAVFYDDIAQASEPGAS